MTYLLFQDRPIELVILDHDGVLVDSEVLAMEIITNMLTQRGIPATVEDSFNQHLGRGFDTVVDRLIRNDSSLSPQEIEIEFYDQLFKAFNESLMPVPGIDDLLRYLEAESIPVGIGSSGTRERVELGITLTDLMQYFVQENIVTRENVNKGKPEPEVFLLVAQRLGIEPSRCLVIEDSPHGVTAAKRAGMSVIGLASRTSADLLADADQVVSRPQEIVEIIRGSSVSR